LRMLPSNLARGSPPARRCDTLCTSGFMDATSIDTAAVSDVTASPCAGYSIAPLLRRIIGCVVAMGVAR